jgi:23S rRNA (uracil747-C5)-methyltransferase
MVPPSLTASVAIPCAYFDAGVCRSCSLLDVAYDEQLAAKQARARELIDAYGDIDWLAPVASEVAGFRTKAKLVIGGTTDAPTLGILDADRHGVDLEGCPIVAEPIRVVLPALAAFITTAGLVPYDIPARRGELKYLIVTANARGELMLRFVLRSTESVGRIRKHLPGLRGQLPQLRVATANLLPEHKAVLEGEEELALSDEHALELPFDGLSLRLLPRSFVQTNEGIAARLYRTGAAWAAELDPASVWDLYCGVGGFALHLASRLSWSAGSRPFETRGSAGLLRDRGPGSSGSSRPFETRGSAGLLRDREPGSSGGSRPFETRGDSRSLRSSRSARLETNSPRVTGVEISADAVASATMAAKSAGLDARFIAADATRWAGEQASAPDLVVVNPPRRGIGPELADWLEASGVRHVLYSSCNAESLARDLAAMPSLRPARAQLFDMFPHTAHFETMVLLQR